MEIILTNKHGEHNYKQKYDMKMRHCPDLNQGSPFTIQALLPLSHSNTWFVDNGWKIILKNKPGKHNYKQKYDLKMRHCLDLNQGSPVY